MSARGDGPESLVDAVPDASATDCCERLSYHAGRPGGRHGWLIYWIGFDNFRKLSEFPPDHRRKVIHDFRIKAHEIASLALQNGLPDTTVQTAAQAGLLPLPGQ